jgi:ParB/RepB/Spo0J family partition protein
MKINLNRIDLPTHDLRASIDEDALDELAASLRDHGQLQPIGVRPVTKFPDTPSEILNNLADLECFIDTGGRFEVVFGARRTRAAQLLEWETIDASILDDQTDTHNHAKKLIENVQRMNMTPMEEAYGLLDLIGDGEANVRRLQMQTGKSREWIRTRLELIDLPDDLQGAVQAGVLGVGVAKAFGRIKNADVRDQYVRAAVENGCTSEQATLWASQAQFAESGLMTMDQIQQTGIDTAAPPQVVDQQYHCFLCAQLHSWRRINTLVICADCQDAIGTARTADAAPEPRPPVDSPTNRA